MSAAVSASRAVRTGDGDLFLAGGVEQMTRAPYVLSKTAQPFGRDMQLFDTSLGWRFVNPKMKERYGTDSMGQTAENVAELLGITREAQDAFALRSQQKAAAARCGVSLRAGDRAGRDRGRGQGQAGRGRGTGRVHPPRHHARDPGASSSPRSAPMARAR